jgi:capsular polysaccharide transport system permease protein
MASVLGNQFRVLGALVGRELDEKFSKGGAAFLFSVLEPLFQIGLLTAWFTLLKLAPTYGTSIALFAATGFFPYYIFVLLSLRFRQAANQGAHQRRLAQETTMDLMIAQGFIQIVFYLLAGIILFSVIYFYESEMALPSNWSYVVKACVALVLIGFGFGLISSVLSMAFNVWQHIWPVASRLLLLLSGIFFVVDFLPLYLRDVIQWNPLVHCLTMFRKGFYPVYPTLIYSEAYVWGCTIAILTFGLCLNRVFRRYL